MKKLRIRKWLKYQTKDSIILSKQEVERIGKQNIKKIILIGYKKGLLVNVDIDNENYMLSGAGKPFFRNRYKNLEDMILTQSGYYQS